ncbi:MAG: YnbE family lipoprotein [Parvularculaceae bacterium]|nr:YnbE family lipoprotein [Parvularculaceae bacterium]
MAGGRPWGERASAGVALALMTVAGCATVKVQAPDKPIEINLNVKITQEVRVTLDKAAADLIAQNPNLF